MLTEQLIATTAVEACSAQLGVIGDDSLADLEVFDLWSNRGDYADGFVAGDQRELNKLVKDQCTMSAYSGKTYLGNEFTLVDVKISATNATGLDLDLMRGWSVRFPAN